MEYIISYSRDRKKGKEITYHLKEENVFNTLKGQTGNQRQFVLVSPKSINTQSKSIEGTSPTTRGMEMLKKLIGKLWRILIFWSQDFPAKLFLLQAGNKDSEIQEGRSFLKSLDVLGKNNHAFFCLRTLKGFYHTTKGIRSLQSLPHWTGLGMTSNGKCLTLKISASPKTGREYSLSDILEAQVDQKYFLSEEMTKKVAEKFVRPSGRHITRAVITNPLYEKGQESDD